MSRAVMTIHGFLTDTNDFGRLYDYLGYYDEVIACQIPGHNGKVNFDDFTVEGTLVAVTACYDRLRKKHDTVDVVGFSMGGALAAYLCTTRDVNKCVLLAPANKYLNPRFAFDAMKYYAGFQRDTYKSTEGKLHQKVDAVVKGMRPYRRNISACLKLEFDRILPNLSRHTFTVFSKLITLVNKTLDNSPAIDIPTLIVRGDLDELVPQSSIDYLKGHFTNYEVRKIADVGHGLFYTNRDDLIIKQVVEYLSDGEVVPDVPYRDI